MIIKLTFGLWESRQLKWLKRLRGAIGMGVTWAIGWAVAGLAIGVVEALVGTYMGGEYKLLVTFSILVVALMIRPYGLFGTVEIERL